MTGFKQGFKQDFMRRHAEALRDRRPMQPPATRTLLLHEQPKEVRVDG
jgi:hypothetical protein